MKDTSCYLQVPSSLTALLDSVVLDLYEQRLQQSGEIDLGNGRAYEGNLSKQIVSRFAHICNKIVFLPCQSCRNIAPCLTAENYIQSAAFSAIALILEPKKIRVVL